MDIIYIIIAIFIIVIGIVIAIGIKLGDDEKEIGENRATKDETIYYQARDKFFTKSEYMFFSELEKQNNGKYYIFSKVRLEDIIQVVPTLEWKTKNNKRKSIRSRHIDFVLINKETGKVFKAIELDGNSHNGNKQHESDNKKDLICKQAGIELIRVRVGENFKDSVQRMLYNVKNDRNFK